MPAGEPGEQPTVEIPQERGIEESANQPPPQRPEAISVAKPDTPTPTAPSINTVDNSSGLVSQETKPTLPDTEWQRILDLGNKSYLDLSPEEMAELQSLTTRGKGLLGSDFNNQLTLKKTEALRIKNEQEAGRTNELVQKINKVAADSIEEAHAIMQEFADRQKKRDETLRLKEAEFRQNIGKADAKTPEQILQETLKDPKMASAKAELNWLDLSVGKPVENVDPELIKKIEALRQNAVEQIMRDPQGYEQKLKNLKSEFFQSRGVDLPPPQPKASSV